MLLRLQRAGLPETLRFHDLRHTCATLLLRQGVNPKSVQELLEHSDVSLPLNVYSHVLPDMGLSVFSVVRKFAYLSRIFACRVAHRSPLFWWVGVLIGVVERATLSVLVMIRSFLG
jgi:Phage integrase family